MAKSTNKQKQRPPKRRRRCPRQPENHGTLAPDTELQYIYNEDTGELRQVVARAGYAPVPMPFGFSVGPQ